MNMFSFQELKILYIAMLTIGAIFVIFSLIFKRLYQPIHKNLPPSSPKLPVIGNLHQTGSYPHDPSLNALSKSLGPIMLLHFGKVPVLVVSSADVAREILRTHDTIFANRPKYTSFEKFFYGCKDVATAPYGESWRQIKSICVHHLLSNTRVHSFRNVIEEEVGLMIEKMGVLVSSSLPINFSDALCTLSNDVVCRVALGRKSSSGSNFRNLLGETVELLGTFYVGDYIPWLGWVSYFNGFKAKLEKTAMEVDEFLEGVVEEHENKMMSGGVEDDQKDFVDVLLWIQKENMIGFPMDRVTIKAIILNMFGAGTDTTYTVLEWTMTELLKQPKITKELQNEIRRIVGDKKDITEVDLGKMHCLKAVFKETLRFHPPIPLLLPRQSTQDVKIKGYDIPAGTHVHINYGLIARDPDSWDQAEEFFPGRFLNSSINFLGHDLQFIPFGAGRRACPGTEFATKVYELALANLLNKFDWSLPCGETGENMDLYVSAGSAILKKSSLIALANLYTRESMAEPVFCFSCQNEEITNFKDGSNDKSLS